MKKILTQINIKIDNILKNLLIYLIFSKIVYNTNWNENSELFEKEIQWKIKQPNCFHHILFFGEIIKINWNFCHWEIGFQINRIPKNFEVKTKWTVIFEREFSSLSWQRLLFTFGWVWFTGKNILFRKTIKLRSVLV